MSLSIIALTAAECDAIEDHLLRLDAAARSTRFAAGVVSDATVRRYLAGVRFGHDALLGAVDGEGTLVAFAHGCRYEVAGRIRIEAAFSVDAAWRGRGLASALMDALLRHAERIGAESLVAMCVARNAAMRRVFAHAGMRVEVADGEVHAQCDIATVSGRLPEEPVAARPHRPARAVASAQALAGSAR